MRHTFLFKGKLYPTKAFLNIQVSSHHAFSSCLCHPLVPIATWYLHSHTLSHRRTLHILSFPQTSKHHNLGFANLLMNFLTGKNLTDDNRQIGIELKTIE